MKSLIIAEKPSLAKNITGAIGQNAFTRKDGYFESSEYIVSWAFGHLFGLIDLEEYLPHDVRNENTSWTLSGLPFCPQTFRFALRKDPKTSKTDPGVRKQFNILKDLCARSDVTQIIHAGDADREGEIIIRIILDQAKNKKPVKRLWLPDQTSETICAELRVLKDDSLYDALASEGYARTYIDWLYGVNLTRLATLKSGSLLRVGRVITPIVSAIYDRDMAIRSFKSEKYLGLKSTSQIHGETLELSSKRTFALSQVDDANALAAQYNNAGAVVSASATEKKTIQPGKLYSLSKLQGVLGKRFGMSPKESLAIVQSLYEAGYVSYPRTNSEYLATAERGKINDILQKLRGRGYDVCPKDQKTSVYNDSKIESHSALTPTGKLAKQAQLSAQEWQVYSTILNRFLAVFCAEDCSVDHTELELCVGDLETFRVSGDVLLQKGWLQYDDARKFDHALPRLAVGDAIPLSFTVQEKETQPPKHYTVDSLNNYLKNPFRKEQQGSDTSSEHQDVPEDTDAEDYNAIFEGVELGTEATRTAIIETAIRSKYIQLKNNSYRILPAGEHLIEALRCLQIHMGKEKTAELGRALKRVYRGELTVSGAIALANGEIASYFAQATSIQLPQATSHAHINHDTQMAVGICPKCGGEVIERKQLFGCSNKDCRFALWKDDRFLQSIGKKLTKTLAKSLLAKGKVSLKDCTSSKTGKTFDCILQADFSGQYPKYTLQFSDQKTSSGKKNTIKH